MTAKTFNFQFRRQPNGNYRFEVASTGQTFEARKCNVEGWELYEITWAPFADGKYHEMSTRRDGWYATRIDAASAAYWLDRPDTDFWTALDNEPLVLTTR